MLQPRRRKRLPSHFGFADNRVIAEKIAINFVLVAEKNK